MEPIAKRKLSHDVLDRLLHRINNGEFPTGSLLPSERQLMEGFRVGRPAIREALQELQRMGLVVITQGDGARSVAPTARTMLDQIAGTARHILTTTPGSLEHLKEARLFFELGVARQAAARASEADVRRLRACIDEQRQASTTSPSSSSPTWPSTVPSPVPSAIRYSGR